MTSRRAAFFTLIGISFAVWIVTIGCTLDPTGIGETQDICTPTSSCDDENPCTKDSCGEDGVCLHDPEADGLIPDGVNANCKVIQCTAGAPKVVDFTDDVDDGNECTLDSCGVSGADHTVTPGAQCHYLSGLGTCDKDGACVATCGFTQDGVEVTCPVSADKCTQSYCDVAQGKCVTEKLDGIPVPGETPGECGGAFCKMGVMLDTFVTPGTPCILQDGPLKDSGGVCNGQGVCIQCNTDVDCKDAIPESECHDWVCAGGVCDNTTEKDGPLASQVPEDCHIKVCTGGILSNDIDPADFHDDANDCTKDECINGAPVNTVLPFDSPCGANGALHCDAMGQCQNCVADNQCPGTDCLIPHCNTAINPSKCETTPEPLNKPTSNQSTGDCIQNVCDGTGNIIQIYLDTDPQDDSNDCTTDVCQAMNDTKHDPVTVAAPCDDAGGVVCDGKTHCVGKPCAAVGECPNGTFCVDGVCCDAACAGTCNACTGAKKGGGSPNGLCGAIMSGDPDNDCAGNSSCGSGACVKLMNGAACTAMSGSGECQSDNCVDGRCCNGPCNVACQTCALTGFEGVCSPVQQGQTDNNPMMACTGVTSCDGTPNGAGACKKNNGQACGSGTECVFGNCVDGVCCGVAACPTCQTCNGSTNKGTCTNLPVNSSDDMCMGTSSCNGSGVCKKVNGQSCGSAMECTSNNCVDGVCCGSSSCAVCQTCNGSMNKGTCTNIPAGQQDTNPANTCVSPNSCNGMSGPTACKKDNGQTCSMGTECVSGNCVDGVCCGAAMCATCQTCNGTVNKGTCTNIPMGMEDNNPAGTCTGINSCDGGSGAGACKKDNGQTCSMDTECVTGNCVDGVCCGSAMCAECQTCNGATMKGSCTNIPAGMEDNNPAGTCTGINSCNGMSGAGACKKDTGQTCTAGIECVSGNCVDGVCCGAGSCAICQTCNGGTPGTCTNIPMGMEDNNPAGTCTGTSSCNGMSGAGACKKDNGEGCAGGAECVSGNCVDGVCCGSAMCATCQTCNGGTPGTCTNIPAGQTDTNPANTCSGNNSCDGGSGAGACKKNDGQTCAMGTECLSSNCVDGVCCNAASCATCQTCNGTMNKGTCTAVPFGQPDNNPMGACVAPDACDGTTNGAAACKLSNGQVCTMANQCASGNCVDGFCCNAVCGAGCQACSDVLTGLGNGVCGNVLPNTDPDDNCSGAQVCNMMGTCTPAPNGTTCGSDGPDADCMSGQCYDGVCCNAVCDQLCEACTTAGKGYGMNGVCEDVWAGDDPENECSGGGTQNCNGAGVCGYGAPMAKCKPGAMNACDDGMGGNIVACPAGGTCP